MAASVDLADDYRAFTLKWPDRAIEADWARYRVASIGMMGRIRAGLGRVADAVPALLRDGPTDGSGADVPPVG